MGIVSWLILGAIAGFVANFVFNRREGAIATVALGIVGALVGGYIAAALFDRGDVTGLNLESIVTAILGALLLLFVWYALTRPKMNLE